jgi:IK cytokine
MLLIVSDLVNLNFSYVPFREEKKEEPETPRYRDRAKERREDQNPDYEPTELGSFHAVAPPGTDLR